MCPSRLKHCNGRNYVTVTQLMSESCLYLASCFFQNLFLALLHPASPIWCPSSHYCPLMHSSPSHPHDHAAGVALQRVLPRSSGIPFLQPDSSSRFSPLHLYVRICLQSPLNPMDLFYLRDSAVTKITTDNKNTWAFPSFAFHFYFLFFHS